LDNVQCEVIVTHREYRLLVGATLDLGEKLRKFLVGGQSSRPLGVRSGLRPVGAILRAGPRRSVHLSNKKPARVPGGPKWTGALLYLPV